MAEKSIFSSGDNNALIRLLQEQNQEQQRQNQAMIEMIKTMQDQMRIAPAEISSLTYNQQAVISSISNRIENFCYKPDEDETFETWYTRYGKIVETDGATLDESSKVRIIIGKLGSAEFRKYTDIMLPADPYESTYEECVSRLKNMFSPTKTLFIKRYECLQTRQDVGQTYQDFATIVNARCERAEFKIGNSTDTMKCLVFVGGLRPEYTELRSRCLKVLEQAGNDATFDALLEECRRFTSMKENLSKLNRMGNNSSVIEKVNFKPRSNHSSIRQKQKRDQDKRQNNSKCSICGRINHTADACHFKGKSCYHCQSRDHVLPMCPKLKNRKPLNTNVIQTGSMNVLAYDVKESKHGSGKFNNSQNNAVNYPANLDKAKTGFYVKLSLNSHLASLFIDTGAEETIISEDLWKQLGKPSCKLTQRYGQGYTGHTFKFAGIIKLLVQYGDEPEVKLQAYVAQKPGFKSLIGRPWLVSLNFLNRIGKICGISENYLGINSFNVGKFLTPTNEIDSEKLKATLQRTFPEICNEELGRCTKMKAHLYVKRDARPVFCGKRPVPVGAESFIDAEIDRLLGMKVLKPVEFSDWAAPIVAVKKKNGKTRVCADFSTGLNDALELNRHPLPNPEDIFSKLHGNKIFSNLDLSDAYLQLELDDESKKMVTINTHRGLFQYQRLPFGVKSAPSIFQKLMDQLLSGISGAFAYLDDLIIASRTPQEHQDSIFNIFNAFRNYGLKLQLSKCNFFVKSLEFLGHIVDEKGTKPHPKRTAAIANMPAPKNITEVRAFLGAINFYGKYIREMRNLRAPLDELLKKDNEFIWSQACQDAFDKAKSIICSNRLFLAHYDPSRPIVVAADASKNGIGAAISHIFPDGSLKVIEHASKALSTAESNYSQIEKEGLALIFAIKKFHKFIYGRKFKLQTDHKPLLAIFGSKKGIPVYTANRLQRWAVILMNYDFQLDYVRTDNFGQVDVLSRLIAEHKQPDDEMVIAKTDLFGFNDMDENTNNSIVVNQCEVLPVTAAEIASATTGDEILIKCIEYIKNGWPKKMPPGVFTAYAARSNNLTIEDNVILLGERVVIPLSLRPRVLKTLHFGHPGIVRMKAIARQHVYWPGMDTDIERTVRKCQSCVQNAKNPTKFELQPWKSESQPWTRLHIDYAGPFDNKMYLVIVDACTKWPEIVMVNNATTSKTIEVLKKLFIRHGLPQYIVSDNGTPFTSQQFADFCKARGIEHIRTAPYHPQSNGQAERFVDTFKRTVSKIGREDVVAALQEFLMSYRNTPNATLNGKSPAEIFFGRKLRTVISLVQPNGKKFNTLNGISQHSTPYVKSMIRNFNRNHGAKNRKFFKGDLVAYRSGPLQKLWLPGTIAACIGKAMYEVLCEDGRIRRYHVNQLCERAGDFDFDPKYVPPTSANLEDRSGAQTNADPPPTPEPILRRSQRNKKPAIRLDPDPSKKSYD